MKVVSVIMPTYNSAVFLRRSLESFRKQTFDDWELVCIDRGSTDGTLDILRECAAGWDRLRIMVGGLERTSQINVGVRETQSEFLYYTGSDFVIDPTLLADAVRACEKDRADGAWTNCISYGEGLWARVRRLERSTYFGSEVFEGVRFFRRHAYKLAGGYDDNLPVFEEYDLQNRLLRAGAHITRVTTACEYHIGEPQTLSEIARKSYYYGTYYQRLLHKQGLRALRYANPIRKPFFKHWRSFVGQPMLTCAFIVMVVVKYTSGALGAARALFKFQQQGAAR